MGKKKGKRQLADHVCWGDADVNFYLSKWCISPLSTRTKQCQSPCPSTKAKSLPKGWQQYAHQCRWQGVMRASASLIGAV